MQVAWRRVLWASRRGFGINMMLLMGLPVLPPVAFLCPLATGFAMGDVVIGIVLQEAELLPDFDPTPAPVLVTVFDEKLQIQSYALAAELRKSGVNAMVYPEIARLPKQFKYADKMKVKLALVLGPDEVEKGLVVVKNLSNGEQVQVGREALVESVKGILNA